MRSSVVALALACAACSVSDGTTTQTDGGQPPETIATTTGAPPATEAIAAAGVVAGVQPPDGDRSVTGTASVPTVAPIDIALPTETAWLVAAALPSGIAVVAIHTDSTATGFVWDGDASLPYPVEGSIGAGPPTVAFANDGATLLTPAPATPAPSTWTGAALWWTDPNGAIRLGDEIVPGPTGLPDGRVVAASDGTIGVLSSPTDRYPHGVLGDSLEADAVTVLEPDGLVRTTIQLERVVEGLSPMWVDLDGDATDELVVTESDPDAGARLVVYSSDGEFVAAGPAIGRGFRWLHQIGSYLDGASNRVLVTVRTPHIGGVAEFYRLIDGDLVLETAWGGITSHVIGSRNIDMAFIGDADGDGTSELVAPTQDRTALRGIAVRDGAASTAWEIDLPSRLISNLFALASEDGIWTMAGLEGGIIRIWPPR